MREFPVSSNRTPHRDILILSVAQKEKEDLDDLSVELELADEDEKIPYVANSTALDGNRHINFYVQV